MVITSLTETEFMSHRKGLFWVLLCVHHSSDHCDGDCVRGYSDRLCYLPGTASAQEEEEEKEEEKESGGSS